MRREIALVFFCVVDMQRDARFLSLLSVCLVPKVYKWRSLSTSALLPAKTIDHSLRALSRRALRGKVKTHKLKSAAATTISRSAQAHAHEQAYKRVRADSLACLPLARRRRHWPFAAATRERRRDGGERSLARLGCACARTTAAARHSMARPRSPPPPSPTRCGSRGGGGGGGDEANERGKQTLALPRLRILRSSMLTIWHASLRARSILFATKNERFVSCASFSQF